MSTQRVNKVLVDCPAGTVRLAEVLRKMRRRVNKCPRCIRFFQEKFGIHPDDLFDSVKGPTITVDSDLKGSGSARCPSPSVKIQSGLCKSPLLERVIMHELTHYAGCMTRKGMVERSESLAKKGADLCMGTVKQALAAAKKRGRVSETR